MDVRYVLQYYYYGGSLYAALRNFSRASHFFEICLSVPSQQTTSAIQVSLLFTVHHAFQLGSALFMVESEKHFLSNQFQIFILYFNEGWGSKFHHSMFLVLVFDCWQLELVILCKKNLFSRTAMDKSTTFTYIINHVLSIHPPQVVAYQKLTLISILSGRRLSVRLPSVHSSIPHLCRPYSNLLQIAAEEDAEKFAATIAQMTPFLEKHSNLGLAKQVFLKF